MADFLSWDWAAALCFFVVPLFINRQFRTKQAMCRVKVGYKKCDVKTVEGMASGTKQKTGDFYFFVKNWVLFCGD